jgi:hypothetical protein
MRLIVLYHGRETGESVESIATAATFSTDVRDERSVPALSVLNSRRVILIWLRQLLGIRYRLGTIDAVANLTRLVPINVWSATRLHGEVWAEDKENINAVDSVQVHP